ncbi:O-antigen ligase [Fusobacterium perfoetens]|uniref:O-antigen ligase family protein n=1 Tax=Fusobacterium perfoetens TaxID=852 RepID=UPI0026EFAD53|nr:O-antigen ligase family protein [Fusobacterium perfoetens]
MIKKKIEDILKNLSLEKVIYILNIIFFIFLFRRGGDSKYKLAIILIVICFFYGYKIGNLKILKKYKGIYISSLAYLSILFLVFLFTKNKGSERIDELLGMSLYSIILFLSLINIELSSKIYKLVIPIISIFSLGAIIRGLEDMYIHKENLAWYRLAGGTYTTIYAGEIGIYFILGILAMLVYKKMYVKLLYIIYICLSLLIIYYTKSRNTMLMLPLALAIIYFLKDRKKGIIVMIGAFLFMGFLIKNPCQIKGIDRLASISSIEKIKKDARFEIFKLGLIKGKENLIIGEGFYKHKDELFKLKNSNIPDQPHYHNIFIETFATQGIIALIMYILLLINIFINMIKNYYQEKDKEIQLLRLLPIGVFIFSILYGMAEPIFYFTKLYMVLFTVVSLNFIKIKVE